VTGKWKDINREHVIKAIQKYDEEGIESYSRNTFLVYNWIGNPFLDKFIPNIKLHS